jgi:hypothetical protein
MKTRFAARSSHRRLVAPIVALVWMLGAPTVASAQIPPGSLEIAGSGAFHSIGRYRILLLSVEGGKMIGREHQVGAVVTVNTISGDESAALTGFYAYHLNPDEAVIPFLKAGAGIGDGLPVPGLVFEKPAGVNLSDFHFGVGGGLKTFLARWAAVRMEYVYNRVFSDEGDFDRHSVFLGFSVFFDLWSKGGGG